ncbi:MAG: nucleotide exchange factor GrpE [Actinobacteria bacterium]|nr:MAG: nucleotide exchange factor GrpE [Actinomycetota bacterium]
MSVPRRSEQGASPPEGAAPEIRDRAEATVSSRSSPAEQGEEGTDSATPSARREPPPPAGESGTKRAPGPAGTSSPSEVDEEGADGAGVGVERDIDELLAAAAQRDEYLALAQRTQADFENYRKRVAKESAGAEARGTAKLARELLPALDNLERALAAGATAAGEAAEAAGAREGEAPAEGPAPSEAGLADGVRLVQNELMSALERLGIQSFSPRGEPFDPALHEAMAQRPVDGVPAGTVVEVYQPGYRLGESVIRPARVVVAGEPRG